MPTDEDLIRVDITDATPLRIAGETRWVAKAKFPKAPRPRSIVIFHLGGELVAIPSLCPHEQANLAEGRFVEPFVLECPVHQNTYDLRGSAIKTYKVEAEDERMFLLWRKSLNEPVPATLSASAAGSAPPTAEGRANDEKIATLERELKLLDEAAQMRQAQVLETLQQMDGMIREVEEKKAAFEEANRKASAANEFVNRVMDTMSEALVVFDAQGRVKEANERLAAVLQEPRSALLNRPMRELFAPEALAAIEGATGAAQVEFETALGPKGGVPAEHLLRSAVLFGASGKKEGRVVVATDIRRIKAAQREAAISHEKTATLLHSMRQGVFVVLASGEIIDPVSQFSTEIFGRPIVGANLFEVLFKDLERGSEAFSLLETAFMTTFGATDFQWDVMADHFPRRVLYRRGEASEEPAVLKVEYCPLRDEQGEMDRLMLIVDDITKVELLEQQRQTHERQTTILKELASNRPENLRQFFDAAYQQLREARELLDSSAPDAAQVFMRTLHTLKGNARMGRLTLIGQATHEAENLASYLTAPQSAGVDGAPERLHEQLLAVHRHLAEYSAVAEAILHVPNDHERSASRQLHGAVVAMEAALGAGLAEPALASKRLELSRAIDGLPSEALTAAVQALKTPGADRLAAERALVEATLARLSESSAFELYSLSPSSWASLYRGAFFLTRAVLRCLTRGQGPCDETNRALERVRSSAGSLKHEYALAVVDVLSEPQPDSRRPRALLRELWRHLACHATLEGLATLRLPEREALAHALAQLDAGTFEALVAQAQVRAGTLTTFLDGLRQEGVSAREVFLELAALFEVGSASEVARRFNSTRAVADLPAELSVMDAQVAGEAIDAWYAGLGGVGALRGEPSAPGRDYLKRLDLVRLARTEREFVRGNFQLLFEQVATVEVMVPQVSELQKRLQALRTAGDRPEYAELERLVETLFDVPLVPSLYRHYEMVAELARRCGKKVEFRLSGDATLGVPRGQLGRLQDALVHLVRNGIDHGLELPEVRRAAGKSEQGRMEIHCTRDGSTTRLSVRDDGQGIDLARVRAKAVALGLLDVAAADQLSPAESVELIFKPHFSTASDVTDISGRGIGMDVVRSSLKDIGATLAVHTEQGRGSEFVITLKAA